MGKCSARTLARAKEFRERHKERVAERKHRYNMEHKEEKSAYNKAYREKHRERLLAYGKAKYKASGYAARAVVARYGITVEEYDALLKQQGGVCAVCSTPPRRIKLSIDHCHKTGKVRGLLCSHCNFALGHALDSIERLLALVAYLERWCGS